MHVCHTRILHTNTHTLHKHYNDEHLMRHFCGQPRNVVNHIMKTLRKGVSMIWNLIHNRMPNLQISFHYCIPPYEVTRLVIFSILPALHTAYDGFAVAVDCISRIRYRYNCRHTFHRLSLLLTD